MRQLYSCNARIDDDASLISYATKVVEFYEMGNWLCVKINRASMTTMEHIRKYVNWLVEHDSGALANILHMCYCQAVANRIQYMAFGLNQLTGEIHWREWHEPIERYWEVISLNDLYR